MANVSRPRGMRPVSNLYGADWNGRVTPYYINANGGGSNGGLAIGYGSIVALTGAADESGNGLATVQKWSFNLAGYTDQLDGNGSVPVGVVVGFAIDATAKGDLPNHRTISTARLVYVCDDPNAMFEIQEDANGGQLAAASVGLNAALTADTPSTSTGFSNQELDTSTAATTASLPIKILAFARRIDNEVSSSYAKVIVKFNRHAMGNATTLGTITAV